MTEDLHNLYKYRFKHDYILNYVHVFMIRIMVGLVDIPHLIHMWSIVLVLSQIIPAIVRSIKVALADVVKLPF